MSGAGAVLAVVLVQWTVGWMGIAAWSQSWNVIKRGHFRITAWLVAGLAAAAIAATNSAVHGHGEVRTVVVAAMGAALVYPILQYRRSDRPATVWGIVVALGGASSLVALGTLLDAWPAVLVALGLVAGAVLLGGVTNGMMLGHWYLNQPGLKPWALARLTRLALVAVAVSAILGIVSYARLTSASTEGAVLGLSGFGEDFGIAFYIVWLLLVAFSGAVVWMARRCIRIRSIQSATGLYYVAILTAGVAQFLLGYLTVNAT